MRKVRKESEMTGGLGDASGLRGPKRNRAGWGRAAGESARQRWKSSTRQEDQKHGTHRAGVC